MDRETIDRILPDGWGLRNRTGASVSARRGSLHVWLFRYDTTMMIAESHEHLERDGWRVPILSQEDMAEIPQVVAALRIVLSVTPPEPEVAA